MVNQRGQITIEYFVIAMVLSGVTLLSMATFHGKIKTTLMKFYQKAATAVAK